MMASKLKHREETIDYHLVQAQFAMNVHGNLSEALLEARKAAEHLVKACKEQKELESVA